MNSQLKLKNRIIRKFIYFVLITIIVLSIIYIANTYLLEQESIKESQLLNTIVIENNNDKKNNIVEKLEDKSKLNNEIETERMAKIEKLQELNSDIVGWIEIEGTNISYPVLQGTDNEFYLTHNYKKEKSKKGSIFLDKDCNLKLPNSNLIIYGHNVINGQMFHDLLKYEEKEFYIKYPVIHFTTKDDDIEYEIMSAFKSRIYYKSEKNVFRYYNFVNAKTEVEYNEFIKNAKQSSLYDTKKTAEYGDKLITLITCSYHTRDGRFVVIGREKI